MTDLQNLQNTVAAILKRYAIEYHLTQRQLAKKLEKEVSYVNKVLRGEVNLTLRTIEEFQDKLNMPILGPPKWDGPVYNANFSNNKIGQMTDLIFRTH